MKEVEQRKQELLNHKSSATTHQLTDNQNGHWHPLNQYRRLPIVPSVMEILSEQRPYLRENIVDGSYENAEHYLDVRYTNILREFFD